VSRLPRLDFPGQFYHVIVRGVNKYAIFRTGSDKSDFLGRLAQNLTSTGSLCYAWALMTNHLHLLILSGTTGLASLMHPVMTGYVGAFNRRYGRVGHLVQNRFKAILCDSDVYFQELIRYIHLNPVRAGIIKTLNELTHFPWTGHSALMDKTRLPWQAVDPVLTHFGATAGAARAAYCAYLNEGWTQGHRTEFEGGGLKRSLRALGLLPNKKERFAYDSRILGDGAFVEKILAQADKREQDRSDFRSRRLSIETLERLASSTTAIESFLLRTNDRSQAVAKARALFVYAATEWCDYRSADIARRLGITSGGVSLARRRGRILAQEHAFREKLLAIHRQ